ncbi:hypothetical protein [Gimesia chilikensis]|uniref:hypothetical protein n=1 Tax=Gimesia chilikensis TaxID=2605989 RepID=UPI0011A28ED1|nr:hypothetical protein [Gimesia chilikensis]
MKRFWLSMVIPAVLLSLLISGCASTSGTKAVAWKAPVAPWNWGKSASSEEKSEKAGKETTAEEETAVAKINGVEIDKETAVELGKAAGELLTQTEKKPTKVTTHNAELLAYIHEELKDATPKERSQYLASFKGVDPEMIKNILRTRRMVNSMQAQQLAEHKTTPATHVNLPGLGHTQPGGSPAPNTSLPQVANQQPVVQQASAQQMAPPGQITPGSQQVQQMNNPVQLGTLETAGNNPEAGLPAVVPGQPQGYSTSETISQGLNHIPLVGPLKTKLSSAIHQGTSAIQNGITRTSTAFTGQQNPAAQQLPITSTNPQMAPVTNPQSAELAPQMVPLAVAQSGASAQDQLQQLISVAESEIAQLQPGSTPEEKQNYIERHVYLRMLYLMAGQHERALEAIPGIEPADQEFWQQTFWAVANYFDEAAIPDVADRATQTVTQLRQATARLQEKANLKLKNVAFCHKISSFGSYERFERDEYTPGRPVLVYSEIENFTSELTADGMYRTLLKSKIQIFKAGTNGDLVAEIPFDTTEDLCRNVRKDYFHSYKFEIPRNISLGPHIMKLTVEDEISQKVATYSQNFTVR